MKKIFSVLLGLALLVGNVAHAASYPVGGYQYYLSGAGITSSATTIQLTSLKTPDGREITMDMFGSIGYGALDPQTTSKLENITFTGITQNSTNDTALLTGVTRGVDFVTPYASDSSLKKSHTGGATFILTNTASFYGTEFGMVNNPSTVTNYWTFPTPIEGSNPATKNYVDSVVTGTSTLSNSAVIGAGTAGETLSAGNHIYLKTSDARWYTVDTDVTESITNSLTGIAQGAGTVGNAITGGVLVYGLDTHQSGLTPGANYFASPTAGAIQTSTTSKAVGKARTTTSIWFNPYFTGLAVTGLPNTFTATTTFTGNVVGTIETTDKMYGASSTFTGAATPQPVSVSATTTTAFLADGNDLSRLQFGGFAISSVASGGQVKVRTGGIVTGFTGLSKGSKYYLNDAVGTISTTTGTYELLVGVAVSSTELLIKQGEHRIAATSNIGTASGVLPVNTGFRPSHIQITALAADTTQGSTMALEWQNGTINAANSTFTSGGGEAGNVPVLYDALAASGNSMTFSIASTTDTGFTVIWTETGNFNTGGAYFVVNAEGEV